MTSPLLISTWSFSLPIIEAEYPKLATVGSALDVVEACAIAAETDESIDSVGFGGLPDREGRCTFDAAVMLSPPQSGAVCAMERHLHPVTAARLVMEQTEHKMLVGSLADDFANSHGLPSENICSDRAKAKWEHWKKSNAQATPPAPFDHGHGELFGSHDTIGTLALDAGGTMAGSCSTSGMAWKVPGRVGDSPIIGHGLYVDPLRGAATATGHGELISGISGAFLVVELMGRGASPEEAIHDTLARLVECWPLKKEHQVAFIAMTPDGNFAGGALRPGFKYAVCNEHEQTVREPDIVLHQLLE
ncbi:MAG: isoaspartyl peptidase/L-asparaginase [Phycisphaerales bacterium]|nr:isoaspartyl peptidase/L-asparaginase [Planctomycetota bacterium]MBL6997216.1 isoaspartyl peptidase/L-asparaginase [Phycisphaerales bacterium]